MPKKKDEGGAPAHVGLFATLMVVLLAFFIIITTMSAKQESGFKAGVGDIQNAFGSKGGFGLMTYVFFGGGKANAPVPKEDRADDGLEEAIDDSLNRGKGGAGQTDAQPQKQKPKDFVTVRVPFAFEEGSTMLLPDMAKYLRASGTGFVLFDNMITIRCYAADSGNPEADRELASKRAATVMRFLNDVCQMPFERMRAVGYGHKRYFQGRGGTGIAQGEDQAVYFYVSPEA